MTLIHAGDRLLVGIRLINPLLRVEWPKEGEALAVLDTGFDGLALLPPNLFEELRLNELRADRVNLLLGDGSEVIGLGTFGILHIPELNKEVEGLLTTISGASEVLIGMEAISDLEVTIDSCRSLLRIRPCR